MSRSITAAVAATFLLAALACGGAPAESLASRADAAKPDSAPGATLDVRRRLLVTSGDSDEQLLIEVGYTAEQWAAYCAGTLTAADRDAIENATIRLVFTPAEKQYLVVSARFEDAPLLVFQASQPWEWSAETLMGLDSVVCQAGPAIASGTLSGIFHENVLDGRDTWGFDAVGTAIDANGEVHRLVHAGHCAWIGVDDVSCNARILYR